MRSHGVHTCKAPQAAPGGHGQRVSITTKGLSAVFPAPVRVHITSYTSPSAARLLPAKRMMSQAGPRNLYLRFLTCNSKARS